MRPIWPFPSRRIYSDISEEIRQHLNEKIEALVADGMDRVEAERRARREFGNPTLLEQHSREAWQAPRIESLLQDVRFAIRMLIRRPAFALITILILALGIGANSAMFSIVSAVLLKPLPYKDSNRLVVVWQSSDQHRSTGEWFDTYREFEIWQQYSHSFEQLAALSWATGSQSFSWRGRARSALAIPTSADFFSMLGVAAEQGRTFAPSDVGRGCAVVLSHAFWQNELGAPADLVGKSATIDQKACQVVGVMPGSFSFYPTQSALWTLITPDSAYSKDPWKSGTGVFGRLKPGVSRQAAESELAILQKSALQEAPPSLALPRAVPVVLDLQSEFTWLAGRNLRTALIVLFGAVFMVLLIACVNVANLLLGQAADRQRELAIRTSLGSGRIRLIRQLMTESLILSSAGALVGIVLAYVAVTLFRDANPVELPPGNPVQLDWQVLAFTIVLSGLTVLLFGFIPAWNASRIDPNQVLKETGQTASHRSRSRMGSAFVVAEVALSLILLSGAGLLIQSLAHLASTPLGFRTDHLLTGTIQLPQTKYRPPDEKLQVFNKLRFETATIPGVENLTLASSFYLAGSNMISVENRPAPSETASHNVAEEEIDSNFLSTLEVPLFRGRAFGTQDRSNTLPVAIVNQALANEYFPNDDPVGRRIKLGRPEDETRPWLTIVGVAGNVSTTTVFQEMGYVTPPAVYRPFTQQPSNSASILLRTQSSPRSFQNLLQAKVAAIDADIVLTDVKTMDERLSDLRSQPRFRTALLAVLAALALTLAMLGIYALLTQSVLRRTREIGIRMALGASRSSIAQLILKQAFALVLTGLCLGFAGSLLLRQAVSALLYGVTAGDPLTMGAVCILLFAVSAVASYIPARRATRIDPMRTIRAD